MTVPGWLSAVIGDFGRAAGLDRLALGSGGAAVFKFETGARFRLEYTGSELVAAMCVPAANAGAVKKALSFSSPKARFGFKIRSGFLRKSGEAVMAIRLAERDVTLPRLNAAFGTLWRLAGETGGSSWA